MSKRKWSFPPSELRYKLIMCNVIIIFFVTLVLTLVSNYVYADSMQNHSFTSTAEMQSQVQKTIDLKIESVENMLEILGNTKAVQAFFNLKEHEQKKRLQAENEIRDLLYSYSAVSKEYLNILVASQADAYISNDSYRILREPLSAEDFYQQAVAEDGRPVVIFNEIERNLKSWKNYSAGSYISIVKAVKDVETQKIIGVLLMDLDMESIKNLVKDITLGETGFVFIMNVQGQVVYSPENKIVYRIKPKWFEKSEKGSIICKIKDKDYNIIYNRSAYTWLTTIGVYDLSKTLVSVSRITYVSYIIAIITLAFSIIWSVVFAASFTKPISKLSQLMKRAQTGDLKVKFDNRYKGEIGQLGDAFNAMVNKINELIGLVYKEQKSKREAEIKILQEQIKPHFLYNTLDTIQWMAKKYKANDIVEMVYSLSNFFRISLSKGKEVIPLRDEITLAESYLNIQKARYEDLFEFHIVCEENILDCKVVKLILQPLVENALYHGIKESEDESGNIWISICKENENTILLTVADDGFGMSESQCKELNELIRSKERKGEANAYGVLNVNDRIKMSYGEPYGLTYFVRPEGGTIVEIRHMLRAD